MEKDFQLVELFEIYKGLLTERQREIFSEHYLYDLSFNEIAEPKGMTRQSVSGAIRTVKEKLVEFEANLHLGKKQALLTSLAEELERENNPLYKRINQIKEI